MINVVGVGAVAADMSIKSSTVILMAIRIVVMLLCC